MIKCKKFKTKKATTWLIQKRKLFPAATICLKFPDLKKTYRMWRGKDPSSPNLGQWCDKTNCFAHQISKRHHKLTPNIKTKYRTIRTPVKVMPDNSPIRIECGYVRLIVILYCSLKNIKTYEQVFVNYFKIHIILKTFYHRII